MDDLQNLTAAELWSRFNRERTKTLRTALVNHYQLTVRKIALRLYVQYRHDPNYAKFEIEDYVRKGLSELEYIINNFKHERDGEFETYWMPELQRSIVNGLLLRRSIWGFINKLHEDSN